ncbi:MAG: 2-dehydropantoate 2-reductase [Desulfobacterales bacterium]|nr:2-dehydropantoate 2-reductase [Desulfobacterales bacterium]
MRIAVIGIGGVGGYFGGKLARHYTAGGDVEITFVARGAHLQQIQKNGLKQITAEGNFTAIPGRATDQPQTCGHFDLVLFCVKGYGLDGSAAQIKNNVDRTSTVITLLNGVDNVGPLKTALPEARVLNGCVYIGAHIVEPGVVRQAGGTCQLLFGPEDGNMEGLSAIETILKKAAIKASLTADIRTVVWEKYLFVSPLASATAYLKQPIGAFVEKSEKLDFLEGLMHEVAEIGIAQGVTISEEMVQAALKKNSLFPYDTKTSLQMDYESGRKIEIDIFTGYIVKKGKELGIPTPLHDKVYRKLIR